MNKSKFYPFTLALASAILFGASSPVTKMLLGQIQPIPLVAFLYLGSGIGLVVFRCIRFYAFRRETNEALLAKKDYLWLIGAIVFGGILAPILLLNGLQSTPSSTASLLLNFEGVATAAIAVIAFKENAGKQVISAIVLVTIGCVLLSWDRANQWGFSLGAVGIILACFCWGIDNNFTRNISAKNPFSIVTIKGNTAGVFSLVAALSLKIPIPDIQIILVTLIVGFFCYGLSTVLFVFAMRELGNTRASAFFGTAPFIGMILSFFLLGDMPGALFYISLPLMAAGAVFLLKEKHHHAHKHQTIVHEHKHRHDDGHHNHKHSAEKVELNGCHSHMHMHRELEHCHAHTPDISHRHSHE